MSTNSNTSAKSSKAAPKPLGSGTESPDKGWKKKLLNIPKNNPVIKNGNISKQ